MKTICILSCVAVLLAGLTSCTIEKRHFRNGYYIDWHIDEARSDLSLHHNEPETTSVPDFSSDKSKSEDNASGCSAIGVAENPKTEGPSSGSGIKPNSEPVQSANADDSVASTSSSAAPIEKNKEQAVGAGIIGALFFILAMVGLFVMGTAPPIGILIIAAFVCCVLCIILASVLYPRETPVKQPQPDPVNKGSNNGDGVLAIGLILTLLLVSLFLFAIGAFFIALGNL